jgi:hypothetical protein
MLEVAKMGRKFGSLILLAALALPSAAANKTGSIAGFVRDSSGIPQMGAVVEVFTRATDPRVVFTDGRGHFSATGLEPGTYHVKVSAPAFLPALRENVSLRSGAAVLVNVTLNTLFEAIQMLPNRRTVSDEEGWKWTLRSAANRPILRVLDGGPVVVEQNGDRSLKARVAFVAGSAEDGYGTSSDMSTNFSVEHSLFSSGTISLAGNVGYGAGPQSSYLRTTYARRQPDGSMPELSLAVRRYANPAFDATLPALQAMSVRMGDSFTLDDFVGVHLGSEYQLVQFLGHASAVRPYGGVDVHLSPNTVVSYSFTSSEPNMMAGKGFDASSSDLGEAGPRISLVERNAVLERARHQEIAVSRRFGSTSLQLAGYSDHVSNTALTGAGQLNGPIAELLPNADSDTFTYNGGTLTTNGFRVIAEQKFSPEFIATVNYSYGGVLDVSGNNMRLGTIRELVRQEKRHSLGIKLSGTAPHAGTRWAASYRLTNQRSLTPVDLFDASPGHMDPYFNLFLRQPIPALSFLPGKMEAMVDLRNLLAEGYVPVIGRDGRTLYLVQSARSIRGGLAFVF